MVAILLGRWGVVVAAVVLVAVAGAGRAAADPQLRQLVKSLSARLETLENGRLEDRETVARLERRVTQADPGQVRDGVARMRAELRQLAEHIRAQATVGESLQEMRSEIDGISQEVRHLKEAAEASAARATKTSATDSSEQTVLLWLKDMVTMLKGQVADLAEGFNITQLLQAQQNSESHTALLEGDIRSLEDSVQTLRAHRRSDGSQLTQLRVDLTELLAKTQDHQNTYANLLDEVSTLRKELLFSPAHQKAADASATPRPRPTKRRHRRRHRGHSSRGPFQVRALEQIVDVMYRRQQRIDDELQATRRNVTSLQSRQTSAERRQEELSERERQAREQQERQRQQLQWQLNVTSSRDNLREIQTSTTQLIREVEELETKLDSRVVELRQDLARLDVGYDTLNTAVQAVRDEQKQLPALTKKVKQEMAVLSERQDLDRTSLLELQSDLLTYSLNWPALGSTAARPASDTDWNTNRLDGGEG